MIKELCPEGGEFRSLKNVANSITTGKLDRFIGRNNGHTVFSGHIVLTFDEFSSDEILTERDIQDYHSAYIDLYNEFRKTVDGEKENINDDIVFEMELIKQIEINIDYILGLVKKYHEDHNETYKFVRNAFRNGSVATTGTALAKVLPPVSRFSPGGERSKKRENVLDKLTRFFEKFFDISSGVF